MLAKVIYLATDRMHWLFLLLLVTFSQVLTQPFYAATDSTVIRVNASQGDDTKCPEGTVPCKTLKQANRSLKQAGRDVTILIEGNATLHGVFEVINSSNVNIAGIGGIKDLIYINCSTRNAGFVISNVYNFSFYNISIVNCTANSSITTQKFALLVHFSGNVLVRASCFQYCNHTPVILLNNHHSVSIVNTTFIDNRSPKKRKNTIVRLSYPGALSIIQRASNGGVAYNISSSVFHYNMSPHTKQNNVDNSTLFKSRGYGGAVFVEIGGNTSGSTFTFETSNFTYNVGSRGGGVYAYFTDSARGNTISLSHCKFLGNSADISGGGLNIGFYTSSSLQNEFTVSSCTFAKNSALIGGGLSFYSNLSEERLCNTTTVTVFNTIFDRNKAVISAAVDIAPIREEFGRGFLPSPQFTDCTFLENTIVDTGKSSSSFHINSGVFFVKLSKVTFGGRMTFMHNQYSAVLLLSATAEFKSGSDVLFYNNTGHNGGAIAMIGFSVLLLNPHSFLNFSSNTAIRDGGAIYHSTNDQHTFLRDNKDCFIKNSGAGNLSLINTTRVVFEGNKASDKYGASMYAESFLGCKNMCKHRIAGKLKYSGNKVFKCCGNITLDNGDKSLKSSANTFAFYRKRKKLSFKAYPGYNFRLKFRVFDDFHHTVKPLMSVHRIGETNQSGNITVRDPYTLSDTIIPYGDVNSTSKFSMTAIGKRQIAFNFEVTLTDCPPGYRNFHDKCKCGVGEYGYPAVIKCEDFDSTVTYKSGMWAGYIPANSKNLYFAPCVAPLCNDTNQQLSKTHRDMSKKVCSKNRRGLMCGRCVHNYSTRYHSRDLSCGPSDLCHLGLLFYFLSEIIPMVVFFVVTVIVDASFTSGRMVTFIFYTQNLDELTIPVGEIFSYLRVPYRLFYGLFNLEFFSAEDLSFCLWKGAGILDVVAMKYVTIAVAFGLVLTVIAILRNNLCSRLFCMRRYCHNVSAKISVVHGLSAFLVICYSQCTKTSFYILKQTGPVGYQNMLENYYTYYGGLPYFGREHLKYAVPALFSLVFVTILPPLVLLLYPLSLHLLSLCGLSEHCIVNNILKLSGINKLKPLIDSFQSCYKDRLRFFAGLYFVYRIAILFLFSMISDSFGFCISSIVLLIVIIGIHSSIRPFREDTHNILDTLLLFNLALISGCVIISRYLINQLSDPHQKLTDPYILLVSTIQLILLYMPMLVAFFLLGKRCFQYLKSKSRNHETEVDDILDRESDYETSHLIPKAASYDTIRPTY